MHVSPYSRRGFTLIELLITVAIIAILTGVASVSYSGISRRGRDAQRKNDLNQLKIVLSTYYNAQTPAQFVASSGSCTTSCSVVTINGSTDPLFTTLVPNFSRSIAVDPLNTGSYVYKYQSQNSNKNFKLTATLENKNDKKGWNGGSSWVADGYVVQDD